MTCSIQSSVKLLHLVTAVTLFKKAPLSYGATTRNSNFNVTAAQIDRTNHLAMKVLSQLTIIKVITVWLCIAMIIAILYNLTFSSQSDSDSSFHPMLSDKYLSIVIADLNNSLIGTGAMHTVSTKESIPLYGFADDDHDRFQQESNGSISRSISRPKYAYVTLLHGVDTTFSYRGFFYNCLIMRKSLLNLGSTADFVVLVGFTYGSNPNNSWINHDLEIMRRFGIITYFLDRLTDANTTDSSDSPHSATATSTVSTSGTSPGKKTGTKKVLFSEMALLKITPFRLTQYERIQFFDGDGMSSRMSALCRKLSIPTSSLQPRSVATHEHGLSVPLEPEYIQHG